MAKIFINDIDDKRLAAFFSLRDGSKLDKPIFIADGLKSIMKAIDTGHEIQSYLSCDSDDSHFQLSCEFDHFIIEKNLLKQIPGFKYHKGHMAKFLIPAFAKDVESLKPPFLFLDGLSSSENMGVICRTASAFGVQTILLSSDCSHPYLRRTVRVSMTGVYSLNFYRVANEQMIFSQLKRAGCQIISLEQDSRSVSLEEYSSFQNKNIALVIGSEDKGVKPHILDSSDLIIEIKQKANVDSLNVAQAATLGLYTLLKD